MKRIYFTIIFAVFMTFSVPSSAEQAAEDVLKAIVKIRSIIPKDAHTAKSLGTEREGNGVVIDSQGHILTTGYLILEAESIEVSGPEGKKINATFVGYDHGTGFGLLRTDKPLSVEPMKLGQSSEVQAGDPVLVAGYGGADSGIRAQVISRQEFTGYWEYILEDAIFTYPPHANFGGTALIGRDGRLLGIGSLFTQFMKEGFGLIPCNVFIPIDRLHPILDDLVNTGRSRQAPRPWLGINAEESHGRVFITRVTPGGPAERAGLQPGNLILTVHGKAVSGLADFYRKVWALGQAGVEVPLSVLQGIQIRDITVHSADRYQLLMLKPRKLI
ncbi:MAG: S1C family serine protease [Deltaproteobacteria bacterium]|nr:S1C family serine protease [Deltaproteobacteria bacterium]